MFLKLVDLKNVYKFAFLPVSESLYVFPCQWNYRPDHCMYGSNCAQAEREGVFILHGNRGVYHNDKQPAFQAVYKTIQKVKTASQRLAVHSFTNDEIKKCQKQRNILIEEKDNCIGSKVSWD